MRLALGEPGHVAVAASDSAGAGLLAKREAEVARLVADGLSNKEIGARLFISEHTVDSHVRSILNKLGCNSRAQIAAWMASSNRVADAEDELVETDPERVDSAIAEQEVTNGKDSGAGRLATQSRIPSMLGSRVPP